MPSIRPDRDRSKTIWLQLAVAAMICWTLVRCAPVPARTAPAASGTGPVPINANGMTPSQQYAGEVLAYMMRVVLGDAGDPELRDVWAARGLNVPLDLDRIAGIMNNPETNKAALFVMDPNILGLSEVLYHYDPRLNLFKGSRAFHSIYPSVELIALRLMLVQKRHRGEKIRLQALIERQALLTDPGAQWRPDDLAAINVTDAEMQLLKHVFIADRTLLRYLKHPFLLAALEKSGCIESDLFVMQARQAAQYRNCRPAADPQTVSEPAVRIGLLPSLMTHFQQETNAGKSGKCWLAADKDYQKIAQKLQEKLLDAVREQAQRKLGALSGKTGRMPPADWDGFWQRTVRPRIAFVSFLQQPLVVVPENADRVMSELGLELDFSIVLLGKNVYRSVHFDPKADVYPAVPRLYLDVIDVKYAQVSEEVDTVSRFIVSKLTAAGVLDPAFGPTAFRGSGKPGTVHR